MHIGLIYGQITGRLRRVVVVNSENEAKGHVRSGEALLSIATSKYAGGSLQELVIAATGITPSGDRAVMVDAVGNVKSVHIADPGCDRAFPGNTLIWHDTAQPGWMYVRGAFRQLPTSRRVFISPRRLGNHVR